MAKAHGGDSSASGGGEHQEGPSTGELTISSNSVNLKQPRELSTKDIDMALDAYQRFIDISRKTNDAGHYR